MFHGGMKWLLNRLINNINVLAHLFWRYSTVDLDCDLEKISRKLKFGIDVPYTFRIHQKKVPTHSTLGTAKIHNGGFTAFFFILI